MCTEDSTLFIPIQSDHAELLQRAEVIAWDEAPMAHRFLLEALDRSLRYIMRNDAIFGGKIVILAGDFCQVLPVLRHSSRAQTVDAAMNRSPIWSSFTVFHLNENMRVLLNASQKQLSDFDTWLLSIGNGICTTSCESVQSDLVLLPPHMLIYIDTTTDAAKKQSLLQLIDWVFPDLPLHYKNHCWMAQRAILAPKNDVVAIINNIILQKFPHQEIICYSADQVTHQSDATRFTTEYLNTLDPPGMPPHILVMKPGVTLMLLRNLHPRSALYNGTRLILQALQNNRLMHCKIASGEHSGTDVFISRITLQPSDDDFPFSWQRRQFPARMAFAMTTHKSQGQTLQRVGVWLHQPVFSHGQLYVSASRVGNPHDLKFAVPANSNGITNNVVYKEALSF